MPKNNTYKNNLGYLGEEFQYQLVKYFIESPKFFMSLAVIVDQNMFTDDHLRRIVGFMKDRYTKFNTCPNYVEIEWMIRENITDQITSEEMLAKVKKMQEIKFNSIDLITSNAEKFFKQQNLAKAINQCTEILKRGNADSYYNMEELIRKALDTNTIQDMGFHLFENVEEDLKEDYRCAIPTGADKLDESLYGGLGKGELGIIISPMGVGKTSCTTGFAAFAATCKTQDNLNQGYKVLHFFFEDQEVNIRRKYYGWLTDIDACDLSKEQIRPIALEKIKENTEVHEMLKENVIAKRLPTGEITASDIKYRIKQYISKGFEPDLVIIDYFECLKPERNVDTMNASEWSQEGITMRKLESIANEFNIAIWVPVQSTKSAIGQEFVGLMHAGGSVKKTQIGHVVITLAQTDEQKVNGTMNVNIGKLRAAKIGRTSFPNVKFNNGTCKFDMSDIDVMDNSIMESGNSNDKFMNSAKKSVAKMVK